MRISLLLLLLATLAGCSSVSVHEEEETATLAPSSRPKVVWVRPFAVPPGAEFDVAGDGDPKARVGQLVAEGILSKSDKWLAPGRLLEPGAPVPPGGLLIEGKILRARQGSRALRIGLGFGAGRSMLETKVKVFYLDYSPTEPWLAFETSGGSNAEPGLAGMLVPSPVAIPVAVTALGGAVTAGAITGKGVTEDARRTGRMIAAAVHERLAAHGVVRKKASAKRPGKVLTPAGELKVLPDTE